MISPLQADDVLLADIHAARGEPAEMHLWWLGQSGFLLQHQGRHLLFDPYLSDSLTRKYADTDKPHERMTRRAIDPARLSFIDVVTSSHNHTDHLDAETLAPLLEHNGDLALVVSAANQDFAAKRLDVPPHRLTTIDAGSSIDAPGFTLHGVPAAHEEVERDKLGRCRFLGYVVQAGEWTIYHSGDTLLYDGMVETLGKWDIDVAILPINGRAPERRVSGNLWGDEAARLAADINAGVAIPCHFDMFKFNTATPERFESEAKQLGQPFATLQCGEHFRGSQIP